MKRTSESSIEAEIERLGDLGLVELRERWADRLGLAPKHQSADLMRRRYAYELQVRAYGGLTSETRQRLRKLYKAFKADRDYTPQSNSGLKPGTALTREWKGVTHKVGVLEEGFEYDGKQYGSLSVIAGLITGSKRSGPEFFGLRKLR